MMVWTELCLACSVSPAPLLPVGLFPGRGTGQEGRVLHRAGHTTLATHTPGMHRG